MSLPPLGIPTYRIALTPGEPAGIGPDLCVQLAQQPCRAELVVVGDPELLQRRARELSLGLRLEEPDLGAEPMPHRPGHLRVLPVRLARTCSPGRLDPANAAYVLDCLRRATSACQEGQAAALVTGPVHKGVINEAGQPFTGHTEFLSELTNGDPVMMLATPELRVALVTTHLPLAMVSAAITPDLLQRVLRVLGRDLTQFFGLTRPRLLVCGLNPHAGEGGYLGREEIEVIGPVLERLREAGMALRGPLPADTIFTPNYLEQADAVVAMYHDQGLPVLKYQGFGRAVNITLGLPIIRTSVDHGTALELAGTGRASSGSLRAAVEAAIDMAEHKARAAGQ